MALAAASPGKRRRRVKANCGKGETEAMT